jgi:NADPH:quinone reductase-like Zn-dependent oxidoreductase
MGTIPDRMRAAYVDELGPASNIRLGHLPVPAAGPTDVVMRVEAVSVNPVDTFVRAGGFPTPLPFPFVIGRDAVGTVAACGSGCLPFGVGERVWTNSLGHAGRQGPAAEYAVVPVERLYRLPEGVDPVTAVAVVHPAATAYLGLFVHGRLRSTETVYVAGAAGHVGRAAVVLAARAGARVLGSARADDLASVRDLGAAVAVDYQAEDLAGQLRAAAPDGVDVHLDTSGHNDLQAALSILAERGRVVMMAGLASRPELPASDLYVHDRSVLGFVISKATSAELADAARVLNRLLADGALRPASITELPLEQAAEAHARLEAGEARGTRLILRP